MRVKSYGLRAVLVGFAMAAGFAQVAKAAEPPAALEPVHRIVCLGDSITQGGEQPGGYVWLVRHYLAAMYPNHPIEVINAGISGHKSNDMLARYQRDVLDKRPDMVTISVGVNDVWHGFMDNHPAGDGPRGIPLKDYRTNVEAMIDGAEKAGARVVILSATVIRETLDGPENRKAEPYNRTLRELAAKHHALYVDYQRPFRALITDYRANTNSADLVLTVDGVHMNPLGNRVMAFTLLKALGVTAKDLADAHDAVLAEMR
jgi:lysophospholipase L1-like esterase